MSTDKNPDEEVNAMGSVLKALDGIEPEAQERVLRWASGRFGVGFGMADKKDQAADMPATDEEEKQFADFPSLHDAAGPKTDPERALVAGYWFQEIQGQSDLEAQALNTALKNLGHHISNITDALSSLKGRKPALVIQTQKMGAAKQARKKYKLTTAGVKAVKTMLTVSQPGEE